MGDALPVSDIPQGMKDALLELKICTRDQLKLPKLETNCFDDLKLRVNGWYKAVTSWFNAKMAR